MTFHCDTSGAERPRAGTAAWAGLALLALPTAMIGMDLTLLHLALPALAADLRPTSVQALWIMDIYGFLIAGFLITMGTLGDRIGRRRLLMAGAAAFGAASVLAAFSTSAIMLIAARAALGVAAATLMPSTLALISNMFADPRQRALAIGIWATMFALGMALGPVAGGLLVERFWWGAAFLAAVPAVAILLILAPVLLPEYRAPGRGRLDLASVGLSLAAILPTIFAIKQFAKDGITPGAAAALAAGIVFAAVFVRRQRRIEDPLLDMALFERRSFTVALLVLLIGLVCVGGALLLVAQHLQLVAGLAPLQAGLWMGPPALAMVAAGVGAPLIARRVPPGHVVAGALALSVPGYLMLAGAGQGAAAVPIVIGGFALVYLGLGAMAALGTDLVVGAAPPEKAGSASAMSEMVQDLGASLGIALLGSLSAAVYRSRIEDDLPGGMDADVQAAISDSLWAAAALAERVPSAVMIEARGAFTAGFSMAALASALTVAGLAAVAAVGLKRVPALGSEDER